MRVFAAAMGTVAVLALGACSSDPRLMNIDDGTPGPDEFAIVPTRQLELPPDLNRLPAPNPGGPSITDPAPVYAPSPSSTGAISVVSTPVRTSAPIVVRFLTKPS